MRADVADRAVDGLDRLAGSGLALTSFWQAATTWVRRVVPFDFFPCWYTLDTVSLLLTGHYNAQLPVADHEVPVITDYLEDRYDPATIHHLPTVSTTEQAAPGDPRRWSTYRSLLAAEDAEHELTALLRENSTCWGAVTLHRATANRPFDGEEVDFLARIAPLLARGTRRALRTAPASCSPRDEAPGVVLLDEHLDVVSATAEAERWMSGLPGGVDASTGRLPWSVLAVAARARRAAHGEKPADTRTASARVPSRSDGWVALHGSPLHGSPELRISVVLDSASPGSRRELLLRASGLSDREHEVAGLVTRGYSTREIARMLCLSPYTVQDHLKAVFAKTGVHSRRELISAGARAP